MKVKSQVFFKVFNGCFIQMILVITLTSCSAGAAKDFLVHPGTNPCISEKQGTDFPRLSPDEFLTEFELTVAERESRSYVPFNDQETARLFFSLSVFLLKGNVLHAVDSLLALNQMGVFYRLVQIETPSGMLWGVIEDSFPGDPEYKGWGTLIIRESSEGHVIYQAPHIIYERYTENIALQAMIENPNAVMTMFAGAHRYANKDYDGDGYADSDIAHDIHSLMSYLMVRLASHGFHNHTPYWFVQFHGAMDRESEPSIVATNGTRHPHFTAESPLVRVDDMVDKPNIITMGVCGWREGDSDMDDGDYYLTATTNIQGQLLERMNLRNSFMHFEIERHARNEYVMPSEGFYGIPLLLDAIRIVLADTYAPVSLPNHNVKWVNEDH